MKKLITMLLVITVILSNMIFAVQADLDIICEINEAGYKETGTFYGSTLTGYGGAATRYSNTTGATAEWRPNLKPGQYNVYVWNVKHSSANTAVQVTVNHAAGTTNSTLNQVTAANGWVSLGTFQFNGGYNGYVKMTSPSTTYMRVSAVRFTPVGYDTGIPAANVDSAQPSDSIVSLPLKSSGINRPNSTTATKLYVSPTGSDSNDGSEATPFQTLTAAQNKIRAIKTSPGLPAGGIIVYLRGGTYKLSSTFTLNSSDSGTTSSLIEYKSYPGENVTITGAENIPVSSFEEVTDENLLQRLPNNARGQVVKTNLSSLGITGIDAIDFKGTNVPVSLYVDNEPTSIAQWPNKSYSQYGKIIDTGTRADSGPIQRGFIFEYDYERPARWTQAVNLWMYGYWLTEYNDDYVKMSALDVDKRWITSRDPAYYGAYGGNRYYACNLIEEIDSPGEWYLGSDNSTLYMYPVEGMQNVVISKLATDLISFDGSSNVIFSGVTLEGTRGNGVSIKSGSNNVVIGCKVRNTGKMGVNITGGTNNALRDSDIYNTGEQGVNVGGGTLSTLTSGNNSIVNCNIHHTGVIGRGSKAGLTISGVGNRLAYNLVHHIQQQGITNSGVIAKNVIENNYVTNTSLDIDDTGGIYFNSQLHGRGNIIRNNLVKDNVGIGGGVGALGIYIDDYSSEFTITGNVIQNAGIGIFVHGGRDNTISGNLIINCKEPIKIVNNGFPNKATPPDGALITALNSIPYQSAPWSTTFPHLAIITTDQPTLPKYNTVTNNLAYLTGAYSFCADATTYGTISNNQITTSDPGLDDTSWKLVAGAPAYTIMPSLSSINFTEIGIFRGSDRSISTVNIPNVGADKFELYEPYDGSANLDPSKITLSWQNIPGILRYTVYIATDSQFQQIVSQTSVSATSTTISGLNYGTTYYWRVEAKPFYSNPIHFNSGHGNSFTTVGVKEALAMQISVAQRYYDISTEGTSAGQYASGSKATLQTAITSATTVLNDANSTDAQKATSLTQIMASIQTFIGARVKDKTLSVYSTYNMNNETIGNRPSQFFLRSANDIDTKIAADPLNSAEKVAKLNDVGTTYNQNAPRYFPYQSVRVAVSARVLAPATNSTFDIKLLKAGDVAFSGTQSNYAAKVVFKEDGQIYPGRASSPIMTYQPNVWYNVKIDADFVARNYDVYINSNLVANDVPMPFSTVTAADQVVFQVGDEENTGGINPTVGTFYVDDVVVETPPIEGKSAAITTLGVNGNKVLTFDMTNPVYHMAAAISTVTYTKTPLASAAVINLPGFTGAKAVVAISQNAASYSVYSVFPD